ncbi:hypothetical protein [Streptosporangium roseum]|uniref:hypothetical protein n=1 Tax=Streptosporangium roseum TaxID=2001 RepID=UPI00331B439F
MRFYRSLIALIAVALSAAACTPDKAATATPTPVNTGAVVDSAFYLCKLVPMQAFRLVSGVTKPLSEEVAGTDDNGDCSTPGSMPESLRVLWIQEGPESKQDYIDYLMDDRRKVFTRHEATKLPSDLGEGYAAYFSIVQVDDQPYQVTARFSCGGKDRIIDLYLAQVAKGRDGIRDMIELMRIAQKRYGRLYACTPGK